MILKGILDSSLGGFTCLRGYAPLGDLARCSIANTEDYQRNLIETHRKEITNFLAEREFLFFPEVVLSAAMDQTNAQTVRYLDMLKLRKGTFDNGKGFKLRLTTHAPGKGGVFGESSVTVGVLEIDKDALASSKMKLLRIDGNHRLSAVKDETGKEIAAFTSLNTPFCIVLYPAGDESSRFEKAVFNNINAKQIPLTSEQNLKNILDDVKLFSDEKLLTSHSFGPAYYLARKLVAELDVRYLVALTEPLKNSRSLALALAQFLVSKEIVPTNMVASLDKIEKSFHTTDRASAHYFILQETLKNQIPALRGAFQKINSIYQERPKLAENGCHGVLIAFLYFALYNEGRQLTAFSRWVTSNRIDHLTPVTTTQGLGYHYHLGRNQAVDAASLVEVFASILEARRREVFVSMEFGTHTDHVYKTIEKVITQINQKHNLSAVGLFLKPIRIDQVNKGHSYTINDEILSVIDGSGLLIADLTQGNKNVYHEVGYMMGLNQGKTGLQENFILIADSSLVKDADIGFNLRPWQQCRFANTLELEEKLTKSLETFYELNGAQ